MRAVRFHQHGGPDVLSYEDAPDPDLAPGEVLVRVRACALNHLDLWARGGLRNVRIPMPHITGSDIAGEVVSSTAPDVSVGRRVMLQPGVSCGRCTACLSGVDNECPRYEVLGYVNYPGGYAEYVKVPAQNLISIPDEIDFVQAAAFPLTFLTAWHMLMTRARLKRGEDVLVLAAGSGVGQAAIQIAFLHGARVFATAGTEDKLERARALGAFEVIHHHQQDIAAEILRLTNRRGVDVVIEHVGEATWAKSVRTLARGGRLVTCGATTGPNGVINLSALFSKQLSILGSYMGTKGELMRAARFFFAGQLKPVVDRTFPLAAAAAAHRRMEESGQFGKIVLEVP
jgi:NADPH:quinone reductase-like Zn-dependent oxidoreductase